MLLKGGGGDTKCIDGCPKASYSVIEVTDGIQRGGLWYYILFMVTVVSCVGVMEVEAFGDEH